MHRIKGQTRAIEQLQAALGSERLHHAYIFHGPIGVGKFTTALAFAQIILCPHAQRDLSGQVIACGNCDSCRLLERDNHPDLHIVRKEMAATSSVTKLRSLKQTNIPIDLLREHVVGGTAAGGRFYDAVAFKAPLMRHHKVFIIDEAHLMDAEGQNALLKTLEEPPPGTFLILITAQEDRLLPTVRSRCHRVTFVPLSDEIVAEWVNEQSQLDAGARQWLVGFAEGSLGRAQLAVACDLAQWAETVRPALEGMARGKPTAALGGQIASMIEDFAKNWVKDHAGASKEAANRQAVTLMLSLISGEARQRLHQLAAQVPVADPEAAEATMQPWLTVIDAVKEAQDYVFSNVNINLVCDHLVTRMDRALTMTR